MKAFRLSGIVLLVIQLLAVQLLPAQDTTLILQHANVVDVTSGKIKQQVNMVIKNGRITAVGARAGKKEQGKTIDLKGAYVMPGLIDAHVHVANGKGMKPETTLKHLQYFVQHGITSVRDAAGDASVLKVAQQRIRSGQAEGADVYYAAFMAGPWYFDRDQHLRKEPYTAWEQCIQPGVNLDSAMKVAYDCGATGVKLYHSIDSAFLPEVVKAAKRHQLKVWGHAMLYPARPMEVVAAGMEVLSHVSMLVWLNKEDSVRALVNVRKDRKKPYADSLAAQTDVTAFCKQMKAHNAILDATLCVAYERDGYVFDMLKNIHAQGVKIDAGTDQIVDFNQPFPALMKELAFFVNRCGFSNLDALRAATVINAEVIGQQHNIGTVAVGKKADLLVLKENPLLDIENLKKQFMVIQAGRVVVQKQAD